MADDPDEIARLKAENTALRTETQILTALFKQRIENEAHDRRDANMWRQFKNLIEEAVRP